MKCPNCGAEANEQEKICGSCGAPLNAADSTDMSSEKTAEEKAGPSDSGTGEGAAGISGQAEDIQEAGAGEEEADAKVEEADAKAQETDTKAQEADAKIEEADTKVEEADAKIEEADTKVEEADAGAQEAGAKASEAVSVAEQQPSPAKAGRKIAAALAAAVAVAAIGTFGIMKMMEKDPKEVVIGAFKSVYAKEQTYPTDELFGLTQFVENAKKSSVESGVTLVMDSCSEENVNQYAGSGIRIEDREDKENRKSACNIGVIYNGMDLANLNVYYGDSKLMMSIPELLDTVFVFDMGEGLAERIGESPFLGPLLEKQGMDFEGLADYMKELMDKAQSENASDPYDLAGLWNRYKSGCEAQENFKAALTVEKAEKGRFEMDGREVTCKGYHVHISKDSVISFLRTSSDFFLKDEALKQAYLENLETSTRLMEFMGASTYGMSAKDLQEQTYEEASRIVQEVITHLDESMADIEMEVYVDKKGRLAAVNGSTSVTRENGEALPIAFEANLKGGTYLTQNATATISFGSEKDRLAFDLEKTGSYDGKQLDSSYHITCGVTDVSGTDTAKIDMAGQYAAESGDYKLNADLTVNNKNAGRFVMSGVVDELEKGTTFHCTMDEIRLESDAVPLKVTLSGEYYQRPLTEAVTEPEGEKMDIFAATEADWEGVFMQAYFGVMGLTSQIDIP